MPLSAGGGPGAGQPAARITRRRLGHRRRPPGSGRTGTTQDASGLSTRLLSGVPVLSLGRGATAGQARQVVVGVPVTEEDRLARIATRITEGSLLLVGRPD